MQKKYIEPEIEVLEITESVYCSQTLSVQSEEEESGAEIVTYSDESAESISLATETEAKPNPKVEAPVETESAETE